jgi:tripartite ATP-independent transporter DctM subunit
VNAESRQPRVRTANSALEQQLERGISIFDRYASPLTIRMNLIGSGILFAMMVAITVSVIMRYAFQSPLKGVFESVGVALACIVFLGVAHTALENRHINIDIFSNRLPPRPLAALNMFIYLLSTGIFAVMAWQNIRYGLIAQKANTLVSTINVNVSIFMFLIAFCLIMLCLVLIRHFLESLLEAVRLHFGTRNWVITLFVFAVIITLIALWIQPTFWQIEPVTAGIIGIVAMFLLFFSGMPIGFLLILLSFIFIVHIKGFPAGFNVIGISGFRILDSFTWAVIGLFILLGFEASSAGFGADLYDSAQKWFGRLRGGLAIATVGAGTLFAAIVGDATASTATFGVTALPEMRKHRYSKILATGAICAQATLGPLIPPSICFIVYGLATYTSVGELLIAGIFPGLILSFFFMLYIYIRCRLDPSMGPSGDKTSFRTKVTSLKASGPAVILFLVVIGGIYGGIFTPTEGGAIGGAACLILSLIMRRFKGREFAQGLVETGKVVSMLFLIVVGALMFTNFLIASGFTKAMANVIVGLNVSPWIIVALTCAIHFFLGCIIDPIAMILLTMPIFFPIVVTTLGYDPVWFGVIVVLFMNLGLITPPFGPVLFALKGTVRELDISTIFRSVWPFVAVTLVVAVILIAFPQISLFLPNLMH